jgi:hypothetical protein
MKKRRGCLLSDTINALEQPLEASFQPYFTWFVDELTDELGHARQIAEGLEAVDAAPARSERNEGR